ncbi:helix-turn-helix transcriptional regulator [uncultured Winogradskyella sp.]|uniref:helix-turn-helix domain-containing protein n=1 Tax=uncultured Winogradskyella sp. TaxID=395353 RepID=UPI00262FD46A|nr:helix-turn-helix transcriptional regulator [uncultured Winogradskyella sp.]
MIAAQHIKILRLDKNYTQSFIAHELNISQKTYSNLECGKAKITLEHLYKLATIYNIEVTDFMQRINKTDTKTVKDITTAYPKISNDELYNGINTNLPYELIDQLKARIKDLNALVNSKDIRIEMLMRKVNALENGTA